MRLDGFFPRHRKGIWVFAGLIISLINIPLLVVAVTSHNTLVILVSTLGLLMQYGAGYLILLRALEPLDFISRAIVKVSGQPNDVIPPPINEPRHETSGLKAMVQTVYDRNSQTPQPASAQVSELADSLPCGVIGLDQNRAIIYANPHAPAVKNAQGTYLMKLLFDDTDSLSLWLDFAEEQKVSAQKIWQRIADAAPDRPERRLYDVLAYYEKDAPGGIETRIITIDRTDTYTDDQDAVDFISIAAHELRGPITVIRGYLDVLMNELGPVLQGDQRELVDRLDVSASRLSGYINNILNVAKYDRSHLKLHLQQDRLSDIYATIADDLQLRARTQNRLLAVTIPPDLPTIAADRNSLTEVIANLVDNAIKYSREGGQVSVSADVDGNFVRCSVRDTGIGIPTSVMGGLFTKFYRSHRSRSSVAGTGLGLYISKAIVTSHGGQIGVSSKENEGSVFSFTVPIYSTVADKLAAGNNGNEGIIESSSGWIKNHSKIGS
ncbi:HAMP domain-containing histidine kinase [Candidatus Saccharibacteria bacterium]|nr:HAMP domain-containing histidine kinase [Candidatus Saccharibacteria bacterium]